MEPLHIEKHSHGEKVRKGLCLFSFLLILLSTNITMASHRDGGGSGGSTPAPPLPPATVTPLPFEGPAPWGTDPATIPGVVITGAMTGSGFISEVVTLPSGEKFWYQKIEAAGFLNEAYIKKENVFQDFPTDPKGSVDVSGNTIFNLKIEDLSEGFSLRTWKDGFKAPISIHADIVESKVATLDDSNRFNEMDMHFSQTPFQDVSTGQILIRQDMGVWITGINGLEPNDVTENHSFVPSLGDLRRTTAIIVPDRGQRSRGDDDEARHGDIDWWNDLEMVKISEATSDAIISFSRCNDYGDPTGRLEEEFEDAGRDNGSRGGCSNGAAGGGRTGGDGDRGVPRPPIPVHEEDNFQLTPFSFDRWGGAGSNSLNSGGLGFGGGTTPFPSPVSTRGGGDD